MKIICETANWKIISEHETAYLESKVENSVKLTISTFYGDPEHASITPNEEYAIVGGDGIVVVKIPSLNSKEKRLEELTEIYRNHYEVNWVIGIFDPVLDSKSINFITQNKAFEFQIYKLNLITKEYNLQFGMEKS